jgi:hypothetical protein
VTAALGEVTPYALAIALSPFGVIVAILLLFTPRPRAAGGAFLAGWAVGIAVAAGVFVALASVVELSDEPPSWASWARLGLGVVLLLVGARLWLRRAGKAEPAWLRSLAGITPARALRLGLLLSANPKTLLLAVAGGLAIGAAELTLAGTVVAVAVFIAPTERFTVTGSSTAVHGVRQLRSGGHCPTGGGCGRSPCAAPGWCPRRSA